MTFIKHFILLRIWESIFYFEPQPNNFPYLNLSSRDAHNSLRFGKPQVSE